MSTRTGYHTRAPFVSFLIALITGIGIAYFVPISVRIYHITLAICLLLTLCFFCLGMITRWKVRRFYGLAFAIFLAILVCVGGLLTWKNHPIIERRHFSHIKSTHLLGFVSSEPKSKGKIVSAEMTITHAKVNEIYRPVKGKLLLKIKTDERNFFLSYGDELGIVSKYQRIAPSYNPYEFDYAAYMAKHQVWYESFLSSHAFKKTRRNKGNPFIRCALKTRSKMADKFDRYFKNKDPAALLSTLVLGYRASLDKELVKAFSATGTVHVLAVSGMHVGIVFAFLAFSLQWMDKNGWIRYIRLFLLLLFVWSYALITGFAPSILRAAFMISIFIVGNTLRRTNNSYNSLAVSAFFLLLYNPGFLTDVGFQLSYLAVIGIIWLTPLLSKLFVFKYKILNKTWSFISMCCAAQLANFPLVLYYFHLFPVYFLPANLFITFPVSLIIYAGFLLLALPINEWTLGIAAILEQFILFVNKVLIQIEQWPFATVQSVWLTSYDYLMLYLIIISMVLAFQFSQRYLLYTSIFGILILGLMTNQQVWAKYNGRRLIIFNVRNQLAIGMMNRAKPIIYSSADSEREPFIRYAVIPALEAYSSIQYLSFIKEPVKFSVPETYISNQYIQFMGKHLLILDGRKKYSFPAVPDWLLVRNNPEKSLDHLISKLKKSTLLIVDGSNSQATIDKWQTDAKRLGLAFYCLKDNFAYVWTAK